MPVTAKGLEGIVANSTRLSDVIGDKGQLIYSGYDINELAGKVSFKEVVYLLWKGKAAESRRSSIDFMKQLRAERRIARRRDRLHQERAENRRPDGRDAHRRFHARALRSGDGQGGDARNQRAPRPQHHGKDRRHRRLFSSRPQWQIAAAGPRRSHRSGTFPLPDQRRTAAAGSEPTRSMSPLSCTPITA